MFPMCSLIYSSAPHKIAGISKRTYLDQNGRRISRTMNIEARVGKLDGIHNSFRGKIINIDVAVCPTRDKLVAGIQNGQEGVNPGGVSDCQRQLRASYAKIMINVPNVNSMISSSGHKRKGLHHGTDCRQSLGFSRCDGLVIGSNLASLGGKSVSNSSLAGEARG